MAYQDLKPRVVEEWEEDGTTRRLVSNEQTGTRLVLTLEEQVGRDALGQAQWREARKVYPHDAGHDRKHDQEAVLIIKIYKTRLKLEQIEARARARGVDLDLVAKDPS